MNRRRAVVITAVALTIGVLVVVARPWQPRGWRLADGRDLVSSGDRCFLATFRYPPAVPKYAAKKTPLADPDAVAGLLADLPGDVRMWRAGRGPPLTRPISNMAILTFPDRGVNIVLAPGWCLVHSLTHGSFAAPMPSDDLYHRLIALDGVRP